MRDLASKANSLSLSSFSDAGDPAGRLIASHLAMRNERERRAAPLSPEDQQIQSMPDASSTKWHRAHITLLFEQFVLTEQCAGYRPYLRRVLWLCARVREARQNARTLGSPPRHAVGAERVRRGRAEHEVGKER